MYGNRGKNQLVPTQDTDTLSLTKVIPVFLSDLSGTVMYQCFSIIYGVDINMENCTMSPNAMWSLKSDMISEAKPVIGTLKPEADIDKVMKYIMDVFVLWLDTKGIKAGSIGDISAGNLASGIAKAIDEADATSMIKKSMKAFTYEEAEFWQTLKKMHNYWVDSGELKGKSRFSEDFAVSIEFDDPIPMMDREKEFTTIKAEVDAGYEIIENALKKLYPRLGEKELQERINHYEEWSSQTIEVEDGLDENENTDSEGLPKGGAESNSE